MRKVSENPLAGTQVWHDFDEAKQEHHFVTHYDRAVTQQIIDQNARLKGHGMGKEWRLARSIPPEVWTAWKEDLGVDIFSADPDMQKKARALYNSNEYHKLCVNDFKI